jgi:[ribosomal protein S5]-alanine N-acetyltransferase
MKAVIQTERLAMRDFLPEDFASVHAYASDPEVTRYTAFGPNTPEVTTEFLQRVCAEASGPERKNFSFAAIHRPTNQLIGSCGLMRSDANGPQYGFGYVLHRDWWRRGFGREMVSALVEFGFRELGARRLWAHVFVGNVGSARIVEELGFREEGVALQSFYVRNTWFDVRTFAMLRSEWELAERIDRTPREGPPH